MKLQFLGGARTIGCTCTLVQEGSTCLLIDLGGDPSHRSSIHIEPEVLSKVRGIVITHAHYDHYGGIFDFFCEVGNYEAIPPLFCTEETKKFLIQFGYKEWLEFGRRPRKWDQGTKHNFRRILDRKISTIGYGRFYPIGDIEVLLLPASHILGSAQVYLRTPWTEGLFTSDFKPTGTYLLAPFSVSSLMEQFRVNLEPNFIVIESTYGKNARDINVEQNEKLFVDTVTSVFELGGNLLVPCFAIGRAQEFMTFYYQILQKFPTITPLNVFFIGSTAKMTSIYQSAVQDSQTSAFSFRESPTSLLEWCNLPSVHNFAYYFKDIGSRGDLREKISHLKTGGFNVFITSGGMLHGPALDVFLELKDEPQSALFFIGYQAPGTSGAVLLDAAQSIEKRRTLSFDGKKLFLKSNSMRQTSKRLPVPKPGSKRQSRSVSIKNAFPGEQPRVLTFNFKVLHFPLFSGHATFEEKIQFLSEFHFDENKKVRLFTTHGNPENCEELARSATTQTCFSSCAPNNGDLFEL